MSASLSNDLTVQSTANSTIGHLVVSSGMFLEPSMVVGASNAAAVSATMGAAMNNGGGGGGGGGSATLPRAESTLFRAGQQLQQQQSITLNPNQNVWMNTLSKKSTMANTWSAAQQQQMNSASSSASRYNLAAAAAATADSNYQLQQQLQQLQIRFFKGRV